MTRAPIRVGIIGVHPASGWAATAHVPALKLLPEYRIAAVSHHSLATAQAAAAKFDVEHACATTSELVNLPDVDLVVVTVKVPRHRELVEAAANAGKAVLCEWPLAVSVDDAVQIRDLARAKRVHAAIGLQTRAAPVFSFVRDLIKDGYIGRLTSSTLTGSGILWGDTLPQAYEYTLDPSNGASMINVPFAHSIDAVLDALDSRFEDLAAKTARVRTTVRIVETGDDVPLRVPDQVAVAGLLANGAFLNAHFRGGLSRGTNFSWEINGSSGDLIVTTPIGYVGDGGFRLQGAQGAEVLRDLTIPAKYADGLPEGIAQSVALAYRRLASDLHEGTHLVPTFDDAVELHRLIDRVRRSSEAANGETS
jgi:predicted dehydrogenase